MGVKSVGFYQATSIDTAKTLASAIGTTVPTTADYCTVQADTQAVRYRDDGTDPTASVGTLLASGGTPTVIRRGQFANAKFISATAGAKLNVEFFKTG